MWNLDVGSCEIRIDSFCEINLKDYIYVISGLTACVRYSMIHPERRCYLNLRWHYLSSNWPSITSNCTWWPFCCPAVAYLFVRWHIEQWLLNLYLPKRSQKLGSVGLPRPNPSQAKAGGVWVPLVGWKLTIPSSPARLKTSKMSSSSLASRC